jgi:hypothetical protein
MENGASVTSQSYLPEEYLTIEEVAGRLKIRPRTIKNKMASGVFRKGVHYFSPLGLGPRFKWSALVAWLEGSQTAAAEEKSDGDRIRMPGGYYLGEGSPRNKIPLSS